MSEQSVTIGRRDLTISWLSLIGYIVSFFAAFGVGEGLASAFGYDVGTEARPPVWVMVASTVPALIVFALPGIAAWIFGRRAKREGERRGAVPAWIGAGIAIAFALQNALAAVVPGM